MLKSLVGILWSFDVKPPGSFKIMDTVALTVEQRMPECV